MEAGRADASGIERVPFVSAGAEPFVFFARRPVAQRALNARTRWLPARLCLNLAIRHEGRSVGFGTHSFARDDAVFVSALVLPNPIIETAGDESWSLCPQNSTC